MDNPQGNTVSEVRASTAHTPGPWEYRPLQFDDWGWVRGPKDNEGRQALVACARSGAFDGDDLDSHRRNGTDPWEANARLIAAAPDMLAALTQVETVMMIVLPRSNMAEYRATLDQVRAASAKATGTTDTHRDTVNEQRA